jgi:hypothetical protein
MELEETAELLATPLTLVLFEELALGEMEEDRLGDMDVVAVVDGWMGVSEADVDGLLVDDAERVNTDAVGEKVAYAVRLAMETEGLPDTSALRDTDGDLEMRAETLSEAVCEEEPEKEFEPDEVPLLHDVVLADIVRQLEEVLDPELEGV